MRLDLNSKEEDVIVKNEKIVSESNIIVDKSKLN